jgi:hypothetical protein
MGPSALLPIRKEGVLWIFIALKNPSPWPGLNPQTLGPVASTPRRLCLGSRRREGTDTRQFGMQVFHPNTDSSLGYQLEWALARSGVRVLSVL